jgi:hypothetical protein
MLPRRLNITDRWAIVFGSVLGLSLLLAGPTALACCQSGECQENTCCYTHGSCMPVGGEGETRFCEISWQPNPGYFVCSIGAWCPGEPCDID